MCCVCGGGRRSGEAVFLGDLANPVRQLRHSIFLASGSNLSAMTITPDLLADRFRGPSTARYLVASVTPALPHFTHCPNPCQELLTDCPDCVPAIPATCSGLTTTGRTASHCPID